MYQTERPSAAGATSWGRLPAGTGYSCTRRPTGATPSAVVDVGRGESAPGSEDRSHPVTKTANTTSQASNLARRSAPPVMRR